MTVECGKFSAVKKVGLSPNLQFDFKILRSIKNFELIFIHNRVDPCNIQRLWWDIFQLEDCIRHILSELLYTSRSSVTKKHWEYIFRVQAVPVLKDGVVTQATSSGKSKKMHNFFFDIGEF